MIAFRSVGCREARGLLRILNPIKSSHPSADVCSGAEMVSLLSGSLTDKGMV